MDIYYSILYMLVVYIQVCFMVFNTLSWQRESCTFDHGFDELLRNDNGFVSV